MPDQQRQEPRSAWLLAGFDATDPADIIAAQDEPGWRGPVYVQPMFTLKSLMHPCTGMRVREDEYSDSHRWWL